MLQAILDGKAGRVSLDGEPAESWRDVFKTYEDLLTAAVWGRIHYLSTTGRQLLLSQLLSTSTDDWGNFESMLFWPRYDFPTPMDKKIAPYLGNNKKFAEPDLVIHFEKHALIVEVKPPNGGVQNEPQWRRELHTYLASDDAKSRVSFLALGNVPVGTDRWLESLRRDYPKVSFYTAEWWAFSDILRQGEWTSKQDKIIVQDCLKALSLYDIVETLQPWPPFLQYLSDHPQSSHFTFIKEIA